MGERSAEIEALRIAILDARPNRCCEDWRTCPYDQHDAELTLTALLPQVSAIWEAGFTAGMSQSHSSLNRMGYIERGRDEDDAPNPYSPAAAPGDSDYVEYGVDVPMPRHLDLNAGPLATCTGCGRSTWCESEVGLICGLPQPSGALCEGTFSPGTHTRDGA